MKCKQCGRKMKIVKFQLPARVYRCITDGRHGPPRPKSTPESLAKKWQELGLDPNGGLAI